MHKEVLDFCNEVRAKLNLPPQASMLPGNRTQARDCPITNTIKAGSHYSVVTSIDVLVWEPGVAGTPFNELMPLPVIQWLNAFDDGAYPELDLETHN